VISAGDDKVVKISAAADGKEVRNLAAHEGPVVGLSLSTDGTKLATAGVDILIGHVRTVDVRPGQAVARGQRIALSGDEGAPDGCHLHVEVRSAAGGLATARDPLPLLGLHPVG